MVIRSYKRVFDLDRRMYSFGDWQLPVPNGIPLRGFVYFVALVLLSLIVWRLPAIGLLYGVLPWPMRHLIFPFWLAWLGMALDPDGRRADLFLLTWLQFSGRRVWARLHRPDLDIGGKLRVRYDASGTELHRAQINGPARVVFDVPVELNDRWFGWAAEADAGEPQTVGVRADQTLRICP